MADFTNNSSYRLRASTIGSLAILVSVTFFGCSSSDVNFKRMPTDAEVVAYNESVEPDKRIVCRDEKPVRWSIPRRTCRYVKDIKDTSDFHRQVLYSVLR